jgi:hypothetical protein
LRFGGRYGFVFLTQALRFFTCKDRQKRGLDRQSGMGNIDSSYPVSGLVGRWPGTGGSQDRLPNLDYYGGCYPALEASADFFAFVPRGNGLIGAVGDISGSGISATMMRLGLRSLTHGSIVDTVEQLNRMVYEISPDDSFATLFYARIYPERRKLQYVSAGHEPALLVRSGSNRAERLERTGTVLGLTDHSRYVHRTVLLEPGDVLVAFTEGISLRESQIVEVVRRYPDARARDLVRAILEADVGPAADRTAIAIRFTGVEEKLFDLIRYAEEELAAA